MPRVRVTRACHRVQGGAGGRGAPLAKAGAATEGAETRRAGADVDGRRRVDDCGARGGGVHAVGGLGAL